MAQRREQIKAAKIELSDEEIANLSDVVLTTLVIRVLMKWVSMVTK